MISYLNVYLPNKVNLASSMHDWSKILKGIRKSWFPQSERPVFLIAASRRDDSDRFIRDFPCFSRIVSSQLKTRKGSGAGVSLNVVPLSLLTEMLCFIIVKISEIIIIVK